MRPDHQDYFGAKIAVELTRKLGVPSTRIIVNQTPPSFSFAEQKDRVEKTCRCEVAAVLPFDNQILNSASRGRLRLQYPDHPLTTGLKEAVRLLLDSTPRDRRL